MCGREILRIEYHGRINLFGKRKKENWWGNDNEKVNGKKINIESK